MNCGRNFYNKIFFDIPSYYKHMTGSKNKFYPLTSVTEINEMGATIRLQLLDHSTKRLLTVETFVLSKTNMNP